MKFYFPFLAFFILFFTKQIWSQEVITEINSESLFEKIEELQDRTVVVTDLNQETINTDIQEIAHLYSQIANREIDREVLAGILDSRDIYHSVIVPSLVMMDGFFEKGDMESASRLAPLINNLNPEIGNLLQQELNLPKSFSTLKNQRLNPLTNFFPPSKTDDIHSLEKYGNQGDNLFRGPEKNNGNPFEGLLPGFDLGSFGRGNNRKNGEIGNPGGGHFGMDSNFGYNGNSHSGGEDKGKPNPHRTNPIFGNPAAALSEGDKACINGCFWGVLGGTWGGATSGAINGGGAQGAVVGGILGAIGGAIGGCGSSCRKPEVPVKENIQPKPEPKPENPKPTPVQDNPKTEPIPKAEPIPKNEDPKPKAEEPKPEGPKPEPKSEKPEEPKKPKTDEDDLDKDDELYFNDPSATHQNHPDSSPSDLRDISPIIYFPPDNFIDENNGSTEDYRGGINPRTINFGPAFRGSLMGRMGSGGFF